MKYPDFFNDVKSIKMYDPLSELLGSLDKGLVEFNYLEIVKAAGHSCPTVAGAYMMTSKALDALYQNETPKRGDIQVEFKESIEEGVAGVIGNVIANITGATGVSGFKGIAGNHVRKGLMFYNAEINSSARFTRKDTGVSVDVFYDHSSVPGFDVIKGLMQKYIQGVASEEEILKFGELWQARVKTIIIDNFDNEIVIKAVKA